MAAPTDVRVEASSEITVDLRWSYPDATAIGVYRSTDGINYSLIATVTPGTTDLYQDSGRTSATRYWYKLSDDGGVTFSSIVTVVTMTCAEGDSTHTGNSQYVDTTKATDIVTPDQFNNLVDQISAMASGAASTEQRCPACVTNGAIVFDCTGGCVQFDVTLDQDVNSMSFVNCEDVKDFTFNIGIKPGECWKVAGWPKNFGFSGDENSSEVGCISGGSTDGVVLQPDGGSKHRPIKFKKCKLCGDQTTTSGNLQMVCCAPDPCTLSCTGSTEANLKACGGWPYNKGDPGFTKEGGYIWTISGPAHFKEKDGTLTTTHRGKSAKVKLDAAINNFPSTPAYWSPNIKTSFSNAGPCLGISYGSVLIQPFAGPQYDCAQAAMGQGQYSNTSCAHGPLLNGPGCTSLSNYNLCTSSGSIGTADFLGTFGPNEATFTGTDATRPNYDGYTHTIALPVGLNIVSSMGTMLDVRTQAMIDGGCSPCNDTTPIIVTAQDNLGHSVSLQLN